MLSAVGEAVYLEEPKKKKKTFKWEDLGLSPKCAPSSCVTFVKLFSFLDVHFHQLEEIMWYGDVLCIRWLRVVQMLAVSLSSKIG